MRAAECIPLRLLYLLAKADVLGRQTASADNLAGLRNSFEPEIVCFGDTGIPSSYLVQVIFPISWKAAARNSSSTAKRGYAGMSETILKTIRRDGFSFEALAAGYPELVFGAGYFSDIVEGGGKEQQFLLHAA